MEKTEKRGTSDVIIGFIQRFRFVLIGLVALVIIGILTAVIIDEVHKAQISTNTKALEAIDDAYANYTKAKDDEAKKQAESAFDNLYKTSTEAYRGSVVDQRAAYLKGSILNNKKDYSGAEKEFARGAKLIEDSYLSPILLYSAASSAEQAGNNQVALDYLKNLVSKYSKTSPLIPRALFNLGRLSEATQKWKDSLDYYQKVIDGFASSNWTKLARDRIIYLKSQAKV